MGFAEFVALTAAMQSMTALTIDAMLPALPEIGRDLGTFHPNDVQLVVLIMLLGCLLYTSPSPRDYAASRMPSSA